METKTIQKTIQINAPKNKVWDVLTTDKLNRVWYAEFSEGTYAETDWQPGSKAIFKDNNQSGLISVVVTNNPYEFLSLEYTGILSNGKEDYESDEAKGVKGGHEIYRLSGKSGDTFLAIECDMAEAYFDMMATSWDRALVKIKELSEA